MIIIIGLLKLQESNSELSQPMLIPFTVKTGALYATMTVKFKLKMKYFSCHLIYPTCVLHSAPYRPCVSDHSGRRKDLCLMFKRKTMQLKTACLNVKHQLPLSQLQLCPQLTSSSTTHHILFTYTRRGGVAAGLVKT